MCFLFASRCFLPLELLSLLSESSPNPSSKRSWNVRSSLHIRQIRPTRCILTPFGLWRNYTEPEIISSQGLSLGAVPFVCKTAWNCASAAIGAQWRRAKCSCRFVQLLPHRNEKVSFLRWHKCYGTAAYETQHKSASLAGRKPTVDLDSTYPFHHSSSSALLLLLNLNPQVACDEIASETPSQTIQHVASMGWNEVWKAPITPSIQHGKDVLQVLQFRDQLPFHRGFQALNSLPSWTCKESSAGAKLACWVTWALNQGWVHRHHQNDVNPWVPVSQPVPSFEFPAPIFPVQQLSSPAPRCGKLMRTVV